ncbi:MAG: GIY-YIG nuclease family protein [Proteobacteria bacterium]|nr:GIY-YIG nuclease family protein [Pseudomonadota bacterium]NBX85917.1 GIY-YIG nuclease family protein [Pseudomonadota bacterium]
MFPKPYYVYFLISLQTTGRNYIGVTQQNPAERLENHNSKCNASTREHAPWKLLTYMVFPTSEAAYQFEKYLHTGSGRAWANKHIFKQIQN